MNERKKQQVKAAQVLQAQIELLKKGCRATDFACREYLSLSLPCSPGEVVAAVHQAIHRLNKGEDENRWDIALAAMTAGQQLLKGLKEAF